MENQNIIQVSGGKDSTATLLWAIERGMKFEAVFCDTGWEAAETYQYLDYLQKELSIEIIRLIPKLNFVDLAVKKKRFPSVNARFCTTELKVVPFVDWLLNKSGNFKIYQGIRAEESNARAAMSAFDDYFKLRKGDYAIRKIKAWLKIGNTATVIRPIFDMKHDDVFELHRKHGVEPNPLYKKGFKRVGCMPCIICVHQEMKLIAEDRPEDLQKIKDAELKVGKTFFGPNYISGHHIANVEQVTEYITKPNQMRLFDIPENQCKSVYAICE